MNKGEAELAVTYGPIALAVGLVGPDAYALDQTLGVRVPKLLFAYAPQRPLAAAGPTALSVGGHPDRAATNLQAAGPRMAGAPLRARLMTVANRVLAQSAAMGALPILYAVTAGRVSGCDYIGPTSWGGMRGYLGKVRSSPRSYDAASRGCCGRSRRT